MIPLPRRIMAGVPVVRGLESLRLLGHLPRCYEYR